MTPETDTVRQVREKLTQQSGERWTQQRLAQELGCSVSAVQKMERQRATPAHGTLPRRFERLAKRAGVQLVGQVARPATPQQAPQAPQVSPGAPLPSPLPAPVRSEEGWEEFRRQRATSRAARGLDQ